jgi:hypothetical protein
MFIPTVSVVYIAKSVMETFLHSVLKVILSIIVSIRQHVEAGYRQLNPAFGLSSIQLALSQKSPTLVKPVGLARPHHSWFLNTKDKTTNMRVTFNSQHKKTIGLHRN